MFAETFLILFFEVHVLQTHRRNERMYCMQQLYQHCISNLPAGLYRKDDYHVNFFVHVNRSARLYGQFCLLLRNKFNMGLPSLWGLVLRALVKTVLALPGIKACWRVVGNLRAGGNFGSAQVKYTTCIATAYFLVLHFRYGVYLLGIQISKPLSFYYL